MKLNRAIRKPVLAISLFAIAVLAIGILWQRADSQKEETAQNKTESKSEEELIAEHTEEEQKFFRQQRFLVSPATADELIARLDSKQPDFGTPVGELPEEETEKAAKILRKK